MLIKTDGVVKENKSINCIESGNHSSPDKKEDDDDSEEDRQDNMQIDQ